MPRFRPASSPAIAMLLTLLFALTPACGSKETTSPTTTSPTAGTTAVPSHNSGPPPAETTPGALVAVSPYFLRDGLVGAGQSRFVEGPDVARGALDALVAGPTDIDRIAGLGTALAKGVKVNSLEISDGVATVDFNRAFETADTRPQVGQVVYTLTQFSSVSKVKFLVDGEPNGATGVRPMSRADLGDVTPDVLVEAPAPGQPETSDFRFAGTTSTSTAVVPWRVEAADGTVLGTGTAPAGDAAGRRPFDTTVAITGFTGPAVLVTYVADQATGAETQPVRVPITIG